VAETHRNQAAYTTTFTTNTESRVELSRSRVAAERHSLENIITTDFNPLDQNESVTENLRFGPYKRTIYFGPLALFQPLIHRIYIKTTSI
jgi:hypothetical protein